MVANKLQRIFQHSHHSEAEQIHFNNAHVRAIFFIPLHYHAAGHGGGLQWHHGIKLALANHHTAGMLAKMAWQILYPLAQLKKLSNAVLCKIEAGILKLPRERIL